MKRALFCLSALSLAACESLFGVDFDDLHARTSVEAGPPDASTDAPSGDAAACSACPDAEHGKATCEHSACAIACDEGFRRCISGCCAIEDRTLATGTSHTCATASSGALYCWGANRDGELGNQSKEDSASPVLVFGLEGGARSAGVGIDFSVAVTASGATYTWGGNALGSLGDGTTTPRGTRGAIAVLGNRTRYVVAAAWHGCAVSATGRASCWGYDVSGVTGTAADAAVVTMPTELAQAESFADVATGAAHACAVGVSKAVYCWGSNDAGELATALPAHVEVPTAIGMSAIAVAAGQRHTCAILANGNVRCWGANDFGQLGVGDTDPRTTPVDVILDPAAQITAGDDFTCVTTSSGAVQCWGSMSKELGIGGTDAGHDGIVSRPTHVEVGSAVAFVRAGSSYACARLLDGSVRCWGANEAGQLGDGTTVDRRLPVAVVLP